MYESTPTAREGEPIRELVPEAIEATANTEGDARSATGATALAPTESMVRLLSWLVIIEAVVIVALLAGWIVL